MNKNEIESLKNEIEYLKKILKDNNIFYKDYKVISLENDFSFKEINNFQDVIMPEITNDDVRLFYSYFKGRNDVYAKRYISKSGKPGYSWVCNNLWSDNCAKTKNQTSCKNCLNKEYKRLTGNVLLEHLKGERNDDRDIVGLYPLHKDDTCYFLVFDFDDHDLEVNSKSGDLTWMHEINALRNICKLNDVPCLVERSRSGNGGHLWIFFDEAIKAKTARSFGEELLNRGMEYISLKNFKYFDRMLPAQDNLPIEKDGSIGIGNLIALPLQGKALKNGNSAFVDDNFNVYKDQFGVLKETKKLPRDFIETYIKNIKVDENNENYENLKPWDKSNGIRKEDIDGKVSITLSNRIFIDSSNIKARGQNALRKLSCFYNPTYFKNKALGFSNYKVSKYIYAGYDEGKYICLPRGLLDVLLEKFKEEKIEYEINDLRQDGKNINVSFNGELYPEQEEAVKSLHNQNTGIISATTSFGKTVVGAYLISERKVNTLILVHNKEILYNWIDGLNKFLVIKEELPSFKTASGRLKQRKEIIGTLYSSHNSLTGIVDVALFSSFGKDGEINPILEEYGMVIMDECHHGAAETVGEVLDIVKAKCVFGLTATPKRDDGKEKLVYMHFGPIRYRYTALDRLSKQNIPHYIYARYTRLTSVGKVDINEANNMIVDSKERNSLILNDVLQCIKDGRTPLVLTKYRKHVEVLYGLIKDKVDRVFVLQSGLNKKEKELQRKELYSVKDEESLVIIAIDKYVGEGFNYPRLDTLMLTMPIKWEGKVEQCAGRLHRDYKNKKNVIVYDYVDVHIGILEKMYQSRLKTYIKKLGYELVKDIKNGAVEKTVLFSKSNYLNAIIKDIQISNKEVIISSSTLSFGIVGYFIDQIKERQFAGVKFVVLTKSLSSYPDAIKSAIERSINKLVENGVEVIEKNEINTKFCIIDNTVVYYGSINPLSKATDDDSIIRIVDNNIIQEMLLNC